MGGVQSRKLLLPGAVLAGVAAAALASCGGGGSSPSTSGTPGPCSQPGEVVMVYPAPGATAIPTLMPGIVFGAPGGALGGTSQALLAPSGGTTTATFLPVTAAPSPLPTPNALPTFANPVYQISGSNGSLLPSGTALNVYYNDYSTSCTPTLLGTFTTQ
jgi:hypothetical protein